MTTTNARDPRYKLWAILILLLCAIAAILSSCAVIKHKSSKSSSIDSVSRKSSSLIDSSAGGLLSKTNSTEQSDWWRTTVQFPRDTNITNIYNYPQKPATIIYEGGKETKQTQTLDSGWFKNALSNMTLQVDSLSKRLEESNKDKKSKPSIWLYVAIVAGIWLAWKGIGLAWTWFTGKYHLLIPKNKV